MSMPGCIDMEEMMSLSSKTCTGININAVLIRIVFCKYCSHRIESPYHSINHQLQKSEAFQSVHHVSFILCYIVLYDFFALVFALIRVRKHSWDNIIQGKQ